MRQLTPQLIQSLGTQGRKKPDNMDSAWNGTGESGVIMIHRELTIFGTYKSNLYVTSSLYIMNS